MTMIVWSPPSPVDQWVNIYHPRRSRMNNHKGLTLLEAVIAMGLFFVAVLAFSGLAITASKGAAASQHLTTATTLVQDKLEQVRRTGYTPELTVPIETTEAYATIPDFPLYKRVVGMQPSRPVPGLQTATVTVWWADDRHSVSVSTILSP